MEDPTGLLWSLAIVIGPIALGAALVYGVMHTRRTRTRSRFGPHPGTNSPPRHVTETATEARQGETRGVLRYMLAFGLIGVVVAMIIIYALV
ncbi:hypothetical protein [Arenibaculum sp.]|jgi:hypothetical protein|uniref:hypothetical protein n=1 Tax=Arenibaculum sp. TaxID=2865862 RepID=UPI002E0FD755|nr:hypothetical protein [Arenibaculum sp.]